MSAEPRQLLWPEVAAAIVARQPGSRMPRPNSYGWIGPIRSPLREGDDNPSFSVLPDSPTDPGAYIDHGTGERGSMADLARALGIPVGGNGGQRPEPAEPVTLEGFAAHRHLDLGRLRKVWCVRIGTHKGRACLLYPTRLGVGRVKYLDGRKPKYTWDGAGGTAHLYGLVEARRIGGKVLYLVNGEPSVWGATQAGVPAVCLCAGEGTTPSAELVAKIKAAGFARVAVVYDLDDAGRKGAHAVVAALRAGGVVAVALQLPASLGEGGDVDDLARQVGDRLGEVLAGLPELQGGEAEVVGWPERQPLPPEADQVPDLPEALLPAPLRPWLADVAERASIPLEFPAVSALVALASVVGRSIAIRPERFDNWTVVPNLWGGIVAPPATLKTHAVSEGLAPLEPLEARAREAFAKRQAEAEARKVVLQTQLASLKKSKTVSQAAVAAILKELAECGRVAEQRYRTCDATVEKLGELLCANPRGLVLSRDELAGWLRTLDKPGREGEREFFLEAWNGTGSFTFDRIGRGTVHVPSLCLSVVGGIQPGKLCAYIAKAIGGGAGADGLLQRLQLLVWPDRVPPYRQPSRWPDREAKRAAFAVFEALDALNPSDLGAEIDELAGPTAPPFLRFDPAAQELFDPWRSELETRLRSPELEDTPAFASHLGKYRSLMPSLALLFDLTERVAGTRLMTGGVALGAAQRAAAWCEFLETHARKVYGSELAPALSGARLLARRIEAGDLEDGTRVRDLYRKHWAGLSTPEVVWPGLVELEARGWLRLEDVPSGGRPRDVIRLRPDLRGVRDE
ncbi:MAG TPA: DUF3987 domain-containing protein [Thermoanaerobaculaceae bacterium]|mgnify:CR=1 FL=1|nr:DUF3987 domain-containing protein [Thermoanaerobaculaceae bacterium]HRS16583.1 DUF3987 domain-containing protein [Thermoanaerobaculaceae bacterium]